MTVVSDSTTLISLAKIDQFELLRDLFTEIIIPASVYEEVVNKGKGRQGQQQVKNSSWIRLKPVKNRLAVQALKTVLGEGEAEAIVLAKEENADIIILDDGKARKEAKRMGLKIMGTVGILLESCKKGKLHFKLNLDRLLISGFRLRKSEYYKILEIAKKECPNYVE
ncbi:DUF3368 domain-containing protein [Candidatus Aerophobetes bacterium]|nr:DUF3368 domain-containing protein [Candidatus Aerophobetes bacterium]